MNLKIKNQKTLIIAIVCLVAVCGAILYAKFGTDKSAAKRGGPGQTAVSVRTQTAKIKTLHDYIQTNGEIEPQTSVDVFPDRGGKVASVDVLLGSYVTKGTVIAKVDPSEPGAQYAQSPVYAPISGTVISTPLKPGTKVSASSVITSIGDVQNLQITSNVPERYVSSLKQGLKATIVLESYPDQTFEAYITRISPVVDQKSRTKEVIMNFTKNDFRINAGMFAKVTLWTDDYEGFIAVPTNAIVLKAADSILYVVNENENTVRAIKVQTGKSVDGETQIISGISEGEKIVIEGIRSLSDGAKIQDITDARKKSQDAQNQNGAGKGGA